MLWFRATRRLEDLEEDFRKLRKEFSGLELQWTEVYDKIRRTMFRVVKSRAILEAKEAQEEPTDGGAAPADPGARAGGRLLTERQREIQQQILRRRQGGG